MNLKFLKVFLVVLLTPFLLVGQATNEIRKFQDSIKPFSYEQIRQTFFKGYNSYSPDPLRMDAIVDELLFDIQNSNFNDFEVAAAYACIYMWKFKSNDIHSCLEYADLTEKAAQKVGRTRRQALAINIKGLCYAQLGDHGLAAKYYKQALDLAEQNNDNYVKMVASANFGVLKIAAKDFKSGIALMESILQEIEEKDLMQHKKMRDHIYAALSGAYLENGDISMARRYYQLARENELKNPNSRYMSFLYIAHIEIYEGNYEKALDILNEFEQKEDRVQFIEAKPLIHLYRAKAFYYKKEYLNAIQEIVALEELMDKDIFNLLQFQESYSIVAKSYRALKKDEAALKYWEKAIAIYSENEMTRIKMIADIEERFDHREFLKELKNNDLDLSLGNYEQYTSIKAEIKKLEEEKQNSKWLIIYLILTLIVILVATAAYFYKSKKSNSKKFEELMIELQKAKELSQSETMAIQHRKKSSPIAATPLDETILNGLAKLQEEHYFLSKNCNAASTAKKLKTNTSYLSKTINAHLQTNFKNYINNLRVEYALKKLQEDSTFRSYSIKAISEELGYKSVNTFTKSFRERTKILPSYYIKKLSSVN